MTPQIRRRPSGVGLLSPAGGYRNDDKLAERKDVLSFTADALPQDVYVVGNPVLELSHTCDNSHNDLFVRISEVDAKGRSRNVSDGYRRGTGPSGTVTIELDAVAHRFRAGSRIRVLVAGGSHPRFARNLGTGEPLEQSEGGCGRRHTPCSWETAYRGCGCPQARCRQATESRTRAAMSRSVASSCTGVDHIGLTGSGTQLVHPAYSGIRRTRSGSASGLT